MNEARKILIVSDAWKPQVNGVVRTYEHLERELTAAGHDVSILGPRDFPLRVPLPFYPEIELALFTDRPLARKIAQAGPERIHIATEGPLGRAARRFCLREAFAFTTSYHTHFPDYLAGRIDSYIPALREPMRRWSIAFLRAFHAPAQTMLVATPSLEAELKEWGFRAPMHRMTRGVDLSLFHPGEKNLFTNLRRPVAVNVGRVAVEKNLEAFLNMPWEGSKIVVGDGPLLAHFRNRFPDIVFTGKKTGRELADHYRSADVFVFPSKTDTFGMVLIEALACGLPIAAYDATGPRDIVTHGFLGQIGEDLSACAREALMDGTPQERFAHVRENYQWSVAAQQFLEAFHPPSRSISA